VTEIGYPMPGAVRMVDGCAAGPHGLEALLGAARARVLRALDSPINAGTIAHMLQAVPSAATHHIGVLERAGLVARRRDGRHVMVTRTLRGTALIGLYEI
jgi:DNA-binding transcriptional ArsR family regulator